MIPFISILSQVFYSLDDNNQTLTRSVNACSCFSVAIQIAGTTSVLHSTEPLLQRLNKTARITAFLNGLDADAKFIHLNCVAHEGC